MRERKRKGDRENYLISFPFLPHRNTLIYALFVFSKCCGSILVVASFIFYVNFPPYFCYPEIILFFFPNFFKFYFYLFLLLYYYYYYYFAHTVCEFISFHIIYEYNICTHIHSHIHLAIWGDPS